MNMLLIMLRVFVGVVFIISAIVKLYPAELLEVALVETRLISWSLAPFLARVLIGLELFLGVMLVFGLYARTMTKIALVVLAFFTVYLLIILIVQGNQDNCNCFGMKYEMTPLQSIIKNIVLAIPLWFYQKRNITHKWKWKWKYKLHLTILIAVFSLVIPFLLSHIVIRDKDAFSQPIDHPMNLDFLYREESKHIPESELREGKWIITFMSTDCPHCIVAAYKLSVINNIIDDLPIYIIIYGSEEKIEEFHFLTKTRDIPYVKIQFTDFPVLLGSRSIRFPSIFFVEDGVIKYSPSTHSFSEKDVKDWLN